MTINGVSSSMLLLFILFPSLFLLTSFPLSTSSHSIHRSFETHPITWKPFSTSTSGRYPNAPKMQHWTEDFDRTVYSPRRRLIAANTTTSASEINALLAFRSSIQNDPTGTLANWTIDNNSTCCSTWKGVMCDEIGQVTGIDLGNVTLNGTITPMIGDLVHLSFLNLSGSSIRRPLELPWVPLQQYQSYTNWSTNFPSISFTFPYRAGLGTLWGPIPSKLMRCKNLTVLDLSYNSLDGELLPQLFTLPKLKLLRLSFNRFPRLMTLPKIPKNGCQSLTHYMMSYTYGIYGAIPRSLNRCRNLEILYLGGNQLNGSIPAWFGELRQLQILSLEWNNLTGEKQ